MRFGKIGLFFVVVAAIALFFWLDLGRFLDLDYLAAEKARFDAWYTERPLFTLGLYFVLYVTVTGLSLPGAAVMTLAGGALFGFWVGLLVVSFASTIGATIAFLVSRFLLQDWVQRRFGPTLDKINRGIDREGAFYLFTLRLVPLFPFFAINLVMGLTRLRTWTFYWVSQVGMLLGTAVYVNAGTQLGRLESTSGILSPALLLSFALLGIFPLLAKRVLDAVQARRVYAPWARPAAFDRNMVVIGAGAAGLVSAYIAAAVKARVTLVERHRMGGDCLNTGCVPSKALIRSARAMHEVRNAAALGLRNAHAEVDFAAVMERVRGVVRSVEPHDSVERYEALGVDCLSGSARITSPWTVEVDGRTLRTRSIVIATGAEPVIPPVPGLDRTPYFTSDSIWQLESLPERLLVVGGGPIGCELAQAFARLGSRVTMVSRSPRLMPREDAEVSEFVVSRLRSEGVEVFLSHAATSFIQHEGEQTLLATHGDISVRIPYDQVLIAAGRRGRTTGFGLEELGIPVTGRGTVDVNDHLQTVYPNILACGDVAGPYQFTHVCAHQAWYAAVNALFGRFWKFRADYSVIPWTTFVDPEVARVGLNEQEAARRGVDYEVTRYGLDDLDRALAEEAAEGFVKVLTAPGTDRVLGATIVGHNAGEMIVGYIMAMRHGLGLNKMLGTIHVYPTMSEGNKFAAGAWKQAHAPENLLRLLAVYHGWQLGGGSRGAAGGRET